MAEATTAPEYLTKYETADLLRVSPRTLDLWRNKGYGPPVSRVGGRRLLYKRDDVIAWVEGRAEVAG